MVQLQLQKCELSFTDTELFPCVCKEAGAETHFSKVTILMTSDYLKFSAVTFFSWCEKGERNPQFLAVSSQPRYGGSRGNRIYS